MKKLVLLLCVVFAVSAVSAVELGDVVNSQAYKTKGMAADIVQTINLPAQNMKMNFNSKIYMKGEMVRVDTQYDENSFNNPAQYQQMKMMKMDKMTLIQGVKNGKGVMIMIYPLINGYVEKETNREAEGGFENLDTMMSAAVSKVGSETFAGVNADKYRVTTDEAEDKDEIYVYVDPSKKIMVGVYIKAEDGSETKMEYKNIELKVDDSVFKVPAGMKKYENVQQMAMAAMGGGY